MSWAAARCSRTSARICVEVIPFVAAYVAVVSPIAVTASVGAWWLTRKRPSDWYLPVSMSRVPGR